MQPTYLPLANVFGTQTRHLVPLFQRPYVWAKDEQWKPLWDDIVSVAQRVLDAGDAPAPGHFLGTVVLQQVHSPSGSVACREVIDGQQRLTTLQIVLHAADHALAEIETDTDEGAQKTARVAKQQLRVLTTNPAYLEEEEKYKVWPTNDDRPAFRQVMEAEAPAALHGVETRMSQAYRFFFEEMKRWLQSEPRGGRATALATALKDRLRLIVLDLDASDEPQAIFETLNAHGTPLLPADLVKNWLLWELTKSGQRDVGSFYTSYWRDFDRESDYWRQKIGTGHAARPRVDTFLQNWLVRRTLQPIAAKHLYGQFLQYASADGGERPMNPVSIMADIHRHGALFREIDQPWGKSRFSVFLDRLKVLDMVVFQPFLLAVMNRAGSDQTDRDAIGQMLESYLVRRMICGAQTRGYGTMAIDLLTALESVDGSEPARGAILTALSALAGSLAWPTDTDFKYNWLNRQFYGYFRRERVLMILRAIEELYQRPTLKSETVLTFDYSVLTIEHIMPQKWEQNWPLASDEEAYAARSRLLQGIGNLTLVTGTLNASLSNSAWNDRTHVSGTIAKGKQAALKEHTKLQMNARLLETWRENWDEKAIAQRASALFEDACLIWPGVSQLAIEPKT